MLAPVKVLRPCSLSKHLHMAVYILILPVTYMRPSEFLALRKKDLVARLVPLLK